MKLEKKPELQNDMHLLFKFALIAHVIMFIAFALYQITIMAYFNIASIALYIIILQKHKGTKQTDIRSFSTIASAIEVVLHQVLAIVCVGSDIGFEYFFIMISIVILLQPKQTIKMVTKIIYCSIVVLILIAVQMYGEAHEPLYTLPTDLKLFFLVIVTSAAAFGIFSFTINQWNTSEHYRGQTETLLSERTTKILDMQEKIIRNFADLVEKRDGSTGGHIKRTSAYVEAIIEALIETGKYIDILTPEYSKMIVSAAPLHDIGKISISDSILCKRGKLTPAEYEIMKTHSSIGSGMLEELLGDLESDEYISLAMDISKYHHERWNGKGYPDGISGENIPLSARIMAVADVFDALTSVRVYKEKFALDEAFDIMKSEAGQQFDPVIINEFLRIKPQIREICNNINE